MAAALRSSSSRRVMAYPNLSGIKPGGLQLLDQRRPTSGKQINRSTITGMQIDADPAAVQPQSGADGAQPRQVQPHLRIPAAFLATSGVSTRFTLSNRPLHVLAGKKVTAVDNLSRLQCVQLFTHH